MAKIKHPQFKGPAVTRQQKRSKERRGNVDSSKMNAGGYYEGMAGCSTDQHGNRAMINFVVTPEGQNTTMIYAHPVLCVKAIKAAMRGNKEIANMMCSAATDHIFTEKTPLNWFIKQAFRIKMWKHGRAIEKAKKKMESEHQPMDGKEATHIKKD